MLTATEMFKLFATKAEISKVLEDDGATSEHVKRFWELVGFPSGNANEPISLTIILQNLAAVALTATAEKV